MSSLSNKGRNSSGLFLSPQPTGSLSRFGLECQISILKTTPGEIIHVLRFRATLDEIENESALHRCTVSKLRNSVRAVSHPRGISAGEGLL